jgi:hypothetical protein
MQNIVNPSKVKEIALAMPEFRQYDPSRKA